MLKLIVQHSPKLLAFWCGLQLRLSKPQWQQVRRLADTLIGSEVRQTTIASLSRLLVDAPDPSNGAAALRISPWTAEDLRAPLRHFILADVGAYAQQNDHWTLYVSLDDSLGEKDKGTRHLEAVAYPHDHTKSHGKNKPYDTKGAVHVDVRLELGARSYASEWRLYRREKTVRRLNRQRPPEQRLRFRKNTTLAHAMLAEFPQLLPPGCQVEGLFDSWYAAKRLLTCCRRQRWSGVCAIKSHRKLDAHKLSPWPPALRHQRYQRVQRTAPAQRPRTSLVRTLQGKLNRWSFAVCVLISPRHPRDKHPKYVLCTDLS